MCCGGCGVRATIVSANTAVKSNRNHFLCALLKRMPSWETNSILLLFRLCKISKGRTYLTTNHFYPQNIIIFNFNIAIAFMISFEARSTLTLIERKKQKKKPRRKHATTSQRLFDKSLNDNRCLGSLGKPSKALHAHKHPSHIELIFCQPHFHH